DPVFNGGGHIRSGGTAAAEGVPDQPVLAGRGAEPGRPLGGGRPEPEGRPPPDRTAAERAAAAEVGGRAGEPAAAGRRPPVILHVMIPSSMTDSTSILAAAAMMSSAGMPPAAALSMTVSRTAGPLNRKPTRYFTARPDGSGLGARGAGGTGPWFSPWIATRSA